MASAVSPRAQGSCRETEDVSLRGDEIHMDLKMKCQRWLFGKAKPLTGRQGKAGGRQRLCPEGRARQRSEVGRIVTQFFCLEV